jgi:hypothetical protein
MSGSSSITKMWSAVAFATEALLVSGYGRIVPLVTLGWIKGR